MQVTDSNGVITLTWEGADIRTTKKPAPGVTVGRALDDRPVQLVLSDVAANRLRFAVTKPERDTLRAVRDFLIAERRQNSDLFRRVMEHLL